MAEILGHFTGPTTYMIEAAALVSALIGHWEDFAIIAALLLFNAGLELWQDRSMHKSETPVNCRDRLIVKPGHKLRLKAALLTTAGNEKAMIILLLIVGVAGR